MKLSIPAFPTKYNLPAIIATHFITVTCIMTIGHHPPGHPVVLPWTVLDAAIPLIPWSIFLYFFHFPFIFFAALFLQDRLNMNRVVASMLAATAIGNLCFVVYPVILPPRPPFHFPGPTGLLFNLIYSADTPYPGCLPSLHVAYAYLAALGYRDEQKHLFPFMLACATLISLSTMTTKQHYAVDVASGIALAWACRWLADTQIEFRLEPQRVSQ